MTDIYFPLYYLEKIKRPGENYLLRAILLDDFPIAFLAFSWLSPQPVIHGLSILCLLISFWCIYEYGYYENDLVAEKYEDHPRLSKNYQSYKHSASWWKPWIWAVIFGAVAIFFLEASQRATSILDWGWLQNRDVVLDDAIFLGLYWIGFLIVSRFCFWVYNYVNKKTRIWLYPILQITRNCGFLAVTATNLVGITALIANVFIRSVSYIMYRYLGGTKKSWPDLPEQFLKLSFFTTMITGISIANSDWSILIGWHSLAFILWFLFRASKQMYEIFQEVQPIGQDSSN